MNTTEFLERLRQIGTLPGVAENWGDEQLLAEATEALRTRFAEEIINTSSGYWRHQKVINTVARQNEYRIPPRAVGQGLQKFEVSTDNGVTWQLMKIVTLGSDGLYESSAVGTPSHYTHYSDYVRVFPTPATSTVKFRFTLYLSPSKLIATPDPTDLGQVISVASNVVTVAGDCTTFLDSPDGLCDFVNTTGCNEVSLFDMQFLTASYSVPLTTITFPVGTDLTRVTAGQAVRAPDTTDQIPLIRELHNSLAGYTAALVLMNLGDVALGEKLAGKAGSDIKRIINVAIPRDKAHPKKIKPRNSPLRRNAGRSR